MRWKRGEGKLGIEPDVVEAKRAGVACSGQKVDPSMRVCKNPG